MPTLFDRLQEDPDAARGANGLRAGISRDLEHLLNTRSEGARLIADAFAECRRSLLTYGIADFSSYSLLDPKDRDRIRRHLEQAIAQHESRLSRVRIALEPPSPLERALRFRVDALMAMGPAREKVQFDAVLQLSTQMYQVR